MLRRLFIALAAMLTVGLVGPSNAQDGPPIPELVGTWDGVLPLGPGLRLGLEISASGSGYAAVMHSPDQNDSKIAAQLTVQDRLISVVAPGPRARMQGRLSPDAQTLDLRFTQNGATVPLVLKRRPPGAPSPAAEPARLVVPPDDAAILAAITSRVGEQKRGVGIVVGVVDKSGKRRIIAYGAPAEGAGARVNGQTLFEIGSITKTFTSLLLTDAVRRGEVRLDDPLSKYVPAGTAAPSRDGREITLTDLATHTSALPRMPANFQPANPGNPYADYPVERLYASLSGYELKTDIGAHWDYSNYGVALLGQAIARAAGADYGALLRTRILTPLGMTSTVTDMPPALQPRFASGYNTQLKPVPHWDLVGFAPAGAIRSSADDMLTLLAAEIGATASPLSAAMADQLAIRRPGPSASIDQALGWQVRRYANGEVAMHGGATAGFTSFAGFDRARGVGVVVLSNTANPIEDLGLFALGGGPAITYEPPLPPPSQRPVIAVDSATLPAFAGRYQVAPAFVLEVTSRDGKLFGHPTGQPNFELAAVGEDEFRFNGVEATVTFIRRADGKVAGLVLSQNGSTVRAPRLAD